MKQKLKRPFQVNVRFTEDERNQIKRNMETVGIRNMSKYIRQMVLNGYIMVPQDEEIKE